MTDLQAASLPLGSAAFDINDAGQAVGRYDVRAFLVTRAGEWSSLDAASGNGALDNALGIDAAGRVVGWRRATGGSG